jgi:hypothetical protein
MMRAKKKLKKKKIMVWALPATSYLVTMSRLSLGIFFRGWSPAETFHMGFFWFSDSN